MLFCNSKLSAGNCVVLDPKKSSTYCREYASGFLELAAVHVQRLVRLATQDYSDRLQARNIHERMCCNRPSAALECETSFLKPFQNLLTC